MSMKNIIIITLLLVSNAVAFGQAQNEKYAELQKRFVFFLDNGFERIDLQKNPSVKRSFFTLGKPQLIIAERNDASRKNLVNSFTIMLKENEKNEYTQTMKIPSPYITQDANMTISRQTTEAIITFIEIKLNILLPNMANPKYQNPAGNLPFGFLIYLD